MDTVTTVAVAESAKPPSSVRSEFELRRQTGGGQFLARPDIEKLGARTLSEIIARLKEVRLERQGGAVWVMSTRTNMAGITQRSGTGRLESESRNCYVNIWLNGVQVYAAKREEPAFDLASVDPNSLEGIEYYSSPANTPAKYQRQDHPCGSLLVWTRQEDHNQEWRN